MWSVCECVVKLGKWGVGDGGRDIEMEIEGESLTRAPLVGIGSMSKGGHFRTFGE